MRSTSIRILSVALSAGVAFQPMLLGVANAQEVGRVGTFRFGSAAMPAPEFEAPAGQLLHVWDGTAATVPLEAVGDWPYGNTPGSLTYTLDSGDLPAGSKLGFDGRIELPAGMPTGLDYEFSVRLTNAAGVSVVRSYRIEASEPVVADAGSVLPGVTTAGVVVSDVAPLPPAIGALADEKAASAVRLSASAPTILLDFGRTVRIADVDLAGAVSSPVPVRIEAMVDGRWREILAADLTNQPSTVVLDHPTFASQVRLTALGLVGGATVDVSTFRAGNDRIAPPSFTSSADAVVATLDGKASTTTVPASGAQTFEGASSVLTYALVSGTLPGGGTLGTDGTISFPAFESASADWPFVVRATNAYGVSADRRFVVRTLQSYDLSNPVAAAGVLPTGVVLASATASLGTGEVAPDRMLLHDASATTGFSLAAGGSVVVDYGRPVAFDRYHLRSTGSLLVEKETSPGVFATVASHPASSTLASGTLLVPGASVVAKRVRITAAGGPAVLSSFRAGNGTASVPPVYLGSTATRVVSTGGVLLSASDFDDASPWSSKTTLSVVSAGGLALTTDGTTVVSPSRPAVATPIVVRALGEDGVGRDFSLQVSPDVAVAASGVLPIRATAAGVSAGGTSAGTLQPSRITFDGTTTGAQTTNAAFLVLEYDQPVTFSSIALWLYLANGKIEAENSSGGWTQIWTGPANYPTSASPVVVAVPQTTTKRIRMSSTTASVSNFLEMRPGAGPAATPPALVGSAARTVAADGTVVSYTDFSDPSPYSTRSKLSILDAGGLSLDTDGDRIWTTAPASATTEVVVRVSADDGVVMDFRLTVTPNPASVVSASTKTPSYVWRPEVPAQNLPQEALNDGDTSSTGFTFAALYPSIQIDYAQPVIADRVLAVATAGPTSLQYLAGDGTWKTVGTNPVSNSPFAAVVSRSFRYVASGATWPTLYELRIGYGSYPAAATPPTLIGSTNRTAAADGTVISYTDFTDTSPYSDRVTLSIQDAGGLPLQTDGDRIWATSPFSSTGTVTVLARGQDTSLRSFILQVSPANAVNANTVSPVAVATSGMTRYFQGASAATPDILALRDGSTQTGWYSATSGSYVQLDYGRPVSFDRWAILGNNPLSSIEVQYLNAKGVWTVLGYGDTTSIGTTYTADKFRLVARPASGANVYMWDFRPGLGTAPAANAAPSYSGTQYKVPAADGTIVSYTDFLDNSPYSARVTLSILDAGGVPLQTDGNRIWATSDFGATGTIAVRATSEDGTLVDQTFYVNPKASAYSSASATPPSSVAYPAGTKTAVANVPDNLFLHDGSTASAFNLGTGTIEMVFPKPVVVDRVAAFHTPTTSFPYTITYQNASGGYTQAGGSYASNSLTFGQPFVTSRIRLKGDLSNTVLQEARFGYQTAAAAATPPIGQLIYSRALSAGGTISFDDIFANGTYSTSVATTVVDSYDLGLVKDGSLYRASGGGTVSRLVQILGTGSDGMAQPWSLAVAPAAGASATTVYPSSATLSAGVVKVGSATDLATLQDGNAATMFRYSSAAAYVELEYPEPVKFSSYFFQSAVGGVDLRWEYAPGLWAQIGNYGVSGTSGSTVNTSFVGKTTEFVVKKVRLYGQLANHDLKEMRLGAAPAKP